MDGEDIFQPGDTLYVLDYLGEGFYNTWFKGAFFETAQFWPGPDFFTSSDYEYGGSVVHERREPFLGSDSLGRPRRRLGRRFRRATGRAERSGPGSAHL